jgi:asparagine synthase (glutamine-hydrolysing)
MCGIAGILSRNKAASSIIQWMTEALTHRGPDANGIFVNDQGSIAFGHTRLSIIDLRPESNQPFFSNNKRFVTVFNGEIYNYRQVKRELTDKHGVFFRTTSDTEVIVEAFAIWGPDMVNRLDGMFAMAIADLTTGKTWLFRDRLGKKPLYYYCDDSTFVFASELKSLLKHPGVQNKSELNKEIAATFLHLGYIPQPHTAYKNIFKFPAGSWGVVNSDFQPEITAFWSPAKFNAQRLQHNMQEAEDHLMQLLKTAVSERMISDVPLGTFLSGGTDSSLVTAFAAEQSRSPLKTFSIGFKESKFDESQYALQVSKHLKTDHTAYTLSEREAVDLMQIYLGHFDEPFADTSAIPTMLVSKLARKEVTVALTGDGGDELFQGYGAYTWANRLKSPWWKMIRSPLRTALALSGRSRFERVSHLLDTKGQGDLRSHIFSQEQYLFSDKEILSMAKFPTSLFRYEEIAVNHAFTEGEKQALFDLQYYLRDDLLVKVDRASMYYALECRSPFLDHHVVEYAFSLHHSLKVRNNTSKWILKKILKQYLPESLVDREKWGFSIPLIKWLKADLRFMIDEYLSKSIVESAGMFSYESIEQLKKEFFQGKDYLYNRLWVLIVWHKWWKAHS